MFADLMTSLHVAVNSAMKSRNFGGEVTNGTPPRSAILAANFGSARVELISLLSLSMISVGVFAGAAIPCQPSATYPGTTSATAGMSGKNVARFGDVTPKARSSFDLMCGSDVDKVSKMT